MLIYEKQLHFSFERCFLNPTQKMRPEERNARLGKPSAGKSDNTADFASLGMRYEDTTSLLPYYKAVTLQHLMNFFDSPPAHLMFVAKLDKRWEPIPRLEPPFHNMIAQILGKTDVLRD